MHCGFAQELRAVGQRHILQLTDRRPRGDPFATFIGEYQEFGNRAAALVPAAATMSAAASRAKVERSDALRRQSGLAQLRSSGCMRRDAMRAVKANQPLREYAVQRRHQAVRIYAHVREAAEHVEYVVGMHR